eukprot:NODE_12424_length_511_cov_537.961340_g12134_i0.p2 GENE.NODE_12424_length_511_cov_537.961340_g12134_i0~~NODE_12424_length_511_cov_537.961340_g12134_i0.p2  ORF type:complete len:108 (-),score=44.50 NODE_12424_length_511_cov_537.961340_g12134_i0:85-408(-)
MANDELACTYAALLLHDDELEITADRIAAVVKAAGLDVQSIYPSLFAKFLAKTDISTLLTAGGGGGGGGAAPAAAAATEAPAAAGKKKKEEPEEEEGDDDMGFGLFD